VQVSRPRAPRKSAREDEACPTNLSVMRFCLGDTTVDGQIMYRTLCLLCLVNLIAPAPHRLLFQAEARLIRSDVRSAPACGRDCTTNVCRANGGCASCVALDVQLPEQAKVTSIHCLTTANYPNDSALREVQCTQDNAWSVFDSPTVSEKNGYVSVHTTFHNRSSDRNRSAAIAVGWE
jgi:hypothetical protein